MANVKISDLTAASAVADSNQLEINESGTSKRVTASQIKTYATSDTVSASSGGTFSGSIGIGTSPSHPLHVKTSTDGTNLSGDDKWVAIIQNAEATDARSYGLKVMAGSTTDQAFAVTDHDGSNDLLALQGDGKLGVGTASPAAQLTVQAATNEEDALLIEQADGTDVGSLRINNGSFILKGKHSTNPVQIQTHDGNEDIEVDPDGFIKFEAGGSERMRITTTGLGVGTTAPSHEFHVNSGVTNVVGKFESTDSVAVIQLKDSAGEAEIGAVGNDIAFYPAGTEKGRIAESGRCNWEASIGGHHTKFENTHGSTPDILWLNMSGAAPDNNSQYFAYCSDSSALRCAIWSDGDIDNHDNSYGGTSDQKLKQQITDASSQWGDIKALQVRKFKFNSDVEAGDSDEHWRLGVIAQEVESAGMSGLVNDRVDKDADGNNLETTTKSVKYSVLYMKAVKALQEAMDRIETLETKVAALEAE